MKDDLLIYTVIADVNDEIKYTANYSDKDKSYYMPALMFDGEFWDNPKYVFETFYPILKRFLSREMTPYDKEEIEGIRLSFEKVNSLIDIIDRAREMGWHKL